MISFDDIIKKLKEYDGETLTFMEVCGSHTQAIAKYGIKNIISEKIKLISGPGCPVCVTVSAYIDKLIEIALRENTTVVTFGDLLRVPGSKMSLREAQAEGASVQMVYSPMDTLKLAKNNEKEQFVFAAIGFETTAPVFSLLLDEIIENNIKNVKLLTSIKTMPTAISWIIQNGAKVDGFIAPGHVCAITGADVFMPIAQKYDVPFAVSGFSDRELMIAIYGLLNSVLNGEKGVFNFYTSIVESMPNNLAMANINKYFETCDSAWRGMGIIKNSGLKLKSEYRDYDACTDNLYEDSKINKACKCGEILMGLKKPTDCPLFSKVCNPKNPQGACMVSFEGSCYQNYINKD